MIKNIMYFIITILLFTHNIFLNLIPYEYQYLFWRSVILLSLTSVSFLLLTEISYQNYIRKFSAFLIFDISLYALIDFIIMTFAETYDYAVLNYISIFISLILTAVFIRCYLKYFISKSEQYNSNQSFIVYKYPKSFWGIFASIYTAPYGHCFLVTEGKKFCYKKGVIIEANIDDIDRMKNKLVFRKIDDVNIEEARKLIGKKWSIFNNCFAVFRRFK